MIHTKPLKVLIACEFSGTVREAFSALGHNTWSCDLLPTDIPGQHYQCDARTVLHDNWDLIIAHPPCTELATSGARWWKDKPPHLQEEALDFVHQLLSAPIPHIALENPVGIISTAIRKPDQIIQPWMFGDEQNKRTCLWLKNLPLLTATHTCAFPGNKSHYASSGKDQWKVRSKTFRGVATAMAKQWGQILNE